MAVMHKSHAAAEKEKVKVLVLVGEHRTTELLPLRIGERLKELLGKDWILEYEKWRESDYVSVFERWKKEGEPRGESFHDFSAEMFRSLEKYERQLREEYGPLLFNLHRGHKETCDIEIRSNIYVKNEKKLAELAQGLAEKHGLRIHVLEGGGELEIHTGTITVEFTLPPKLLKKLQSEQLKSAAQQTNDPEHTYQTDDESSPEFKKRVEAYANYMADLLREVDRRKSEFS